MDLTTMGTPKKKAKNAYTGYYQFKPKEKEQYLTVMPVKCGCDFDEILNEGDAPSGGFYQQKIWCSNG